jgi:hypothetical protein
MMSEIERPLVLGMCSFHRRARSYAGSHTTIADSNSVVAPSLHNGFIIEHGF